MVPASEVVLASGVVLAGEVLLKVAELLDLPTDLFEMVTSLS